jgi:hypothetical protein
MPQDMGFPEKSFTPDQLRDIYDSGFKGTVYDPTADAALYGVANTFYGEFAGAVDRGKGKLSLPFKMAVALDDEFGAYEAQTTGDCVSHSTRNAGMMDYCADAAWGQTEFRGRLATENIYGFRGHGGQGASCSRLALYVSQDGPGGFLTRDRYEEGGNSVDLSRYKSSIGHNWGRRGTPSWLNKIAAKNKALRVLDLNSIEEARDALAVGFGISMCSGLGFSSSRNKDGLAERKGGWAHAMAWIACDDSPWAYDNYGGPLFLVQNSWGRWNSGPRRNEQPEGSFWIRPKIADSMIRGGGGWVIASVRGYERELVLDRASFIERESRA